MDAARDPPPDGPLCTSPHSKSGAPSRLRSLIRTVLVLGLVDELGERRVCVVAPRTHDDPLRLSDDLPAARRLVELLAECYGLGVELGVGQHDRCSGGESAGGDLVVAEPVDRVGVQVHRPEPSLPGAQRHRQGAVDPARASAQRVDRLAVVASARLNNESTVRATILGTTLSRQGAPTADR